MNQTLTPGGLQQIATRIVNGVNPQKVILFGSYAWGTPGPGSDIDILVILSTSLLRRERRRRISDLLRTRPVPIDIFVYTSEEIERATQVKGSFVTEILKRGKILYERP
ncbi:MAG: nucleotidyltransferase domain-containing protein [Chlamydiae bacterium]|nr:nucleotidyltransferase domain-containing protein [Chlamydiota bacterium]MBI3277892.1 nucleotidyltransferase domain-containing protein [Chlamydiota bacterium]